MDKNKKMAEAVVLLHEVLGGWNEDEVVNYPEGLPSFDELVLLVGAVKFKPTKYISHVDPGHAWLEVQRSELEALGIAGGISSCSYQKGDSVYLEEDCDASLFIAAKEKIGEKVEYEEIFKDPTPIRDYKGYTARRGKMKIIEIYPFGYCNNRLHLSALANNKAEEKKIREAVNDYLERDSLERESEDYDEVITASSKYWLDEIKRFLLANGIVLTDTETIEL
jgi:hypothetical protein